jgi:hypothetical protein
MNFLCLWPGWLVRKGERIGYNPAEYKPGLGPLYGRRDGVRLILHAWGPRLTVCRAVSREPISAA